MTELQEAQPIIELDLSFKVKESIPKECPFNCFICPTCPKCPADKPKHQKQKSEKGLGKND